MEGQSLIIFYIIFIISSDDVHDSIHYCIDDNVRDLHTIKLRAMQNGYRINACSS